MTSVPNRADVVHSKITFTWPFFFTKLTE